MIEWVTQQEQNDVGTCIYLKNMADFYCAGLQKKRGNRQKIQKTIKTRQGNRKENKERKE